MRDDLTLLHFSHMPRCTALVDKRFEGYWTIQLKTGGSAYLSYDRERHVLDGAWAWPCYPGPRIRFGPREPDGWWHHRYIAFLGPCVARWQALGLWFDRPQRLSDGTASQLAALFDALLSQAPRTDPLGRLRTTNLVEHLLIELADARRTPRDRRPEWLSTVMRRLEEVGRAEPDYERLARSVSMSVSTLRRRFHAASGVSPHAYHLRCKIAAARALLGDTDLPIKQIADRLGYQDVCYFTRQFKKYAGVPPAAYRRSRQG